MSDEVIRQRRDWWFGEWINDDGSPPWSLPWEVLKPHLRREIQAPASQEKTRDHE